jgi:hypothetical protein
MTRMNTTTIHRRTASTITMLFAATLAACGGGYGGGGSSGGGGGGCGAYSSCTPSVTIANATGSVGGTVTLTANATAAGTYTVSSVQFLVDGTAVGTADTTAPFNYAWDSTSVADGPHQITATVTDSAAQTATSVAVTLTVSNNGSFAVTLAANQLFPVPVTTATGSGTITINKVSGAASGHVMLGGITPTSVEIGDAYAGALGSTVIALVQNGVTATQWDVPAATTLTAPQLADLAAGKLYVLVRTAAYLNGELRAQMLPPGLALKFAALTGGEEVPPVVSGGSGQIAVTVDAAGLKAAVHVNVAGVSGTGPTGAELASGARGVAGTTVATLTVDGADPNHLLNESITLTAVQVTDFNSGLWYGNVFSTAHAGGELRGQIADPVTLTKLQTDFFTPICSVSCHTGVGAGLPGSQDLTNGHTYASVVNVTSIEDATLLRIKPGDPDNSYLVRKLEGTGIAPGTARMPFGGPYLTAAQIAEVRAWVAAGAQKN